MTVVTSIFSVVGLVSSLTVSFLILVFIVSLVKGNKCFANVFESMFDAIECVFRTKDHTKQCGCSCTPATTGTPAT